nr:uncharacterized protein LOC113818475 [Penaeus vannamei]XP_027226464.1 uncharacterized protein LOC113818475 [Penaeus vannamei]
MPSAGVDRRVPLRDCERRLLMLLVCAKGPGELCNLPEAPCTSDLSCQLGICLPDVEVLSRLIRAADPQTFDPDRTQRHDHLHDHEPQEPDNAREHDALHDHTREVGH